MRGLRRGTAIFGESGGGGKAITLMTMPSAKGLFHKAIVQSGSILAANTVEISHRVAEKLLKHSTWDRAMRVQV